MKNSKLALAVLALVACTSLPAAAQFGSLLASVKPGASSNEGAGNIDQSLKVFSDKSSTIELTLYSASMAMAHAYASEEQRAQLASQRESIAKITDPKEASAKRAEAIQSAQSIAGQAAAEGSLDEKTKALSEGKKKLLARGVTLFLSGALQARDLLPSGQNLLASASSNPMNIGKLAGVKDSLPRLGKAVSYAGDSLPKLVQALRGANVKVIEPKSSTESIAGIPDADFAS